MATRTHPIPEESFTPEQLRDMLIAALDKAVIAFDSDEFQIIVLRLAEDEKKLAKKTRNKLYRMTVNLQNQALADIRDRLRENESALLEATAALRENAQRVERVAELLETSGTILSLTTQILKPL